MNLDDALEKVQALLERLDERGYLLGRESTTLEMKEAFGFGNIGKYVKTLASFANKAGGVIVFGIKDSPRVPVGIDRNKFDAIQVEKLSSIMSDYFSPLMKWRIGLLEHSGKSYGLLCVEEAQEKPVICKKSAGKDLREGSIYYRYRGQSKHILYPELRTIYDEIRDRERKLWMKHLEQISRIGPEHVALIDLFQGEIETDTNKFIIQQELLEQLKGSVGFIKEGEFREKGGAPVLKVVGEVEAAEAVIVANPDPDKDYPYFNKTFQERFGLRQYDVNLLIWKLGLKGNKKYHLAAKTSKQSSVHKYSTYAMEEIAKVYVDNFSELESYLKGLSDECQKEIRKGTAV